MSGGSGSGTTIRYGISAGMRSIAPSSGWTPSALYISETDVKSVTVITASIRWYMS